MVVPEVAAVEPPAAIQGPVTLRREQALGQSYFRRGHAKLIDPSGAMPDFRFEVGGPLRSEAVQDAIMEAQGLDTARVFINEQEPGRPPFLNGLENVRIDHFVDARNRVDGERTRLSGVTSTNQGFLEEISETLSVIRITYLERPVRPGEEWAGEVYRWDTRPFGWVAARLSPEYRFVGVEGEGDERVAVVEWRVEVEIEPFRAMHFHMAGEGVLLGSSRLRISDGLTGRLELRGTVDLWAAASAGRPANPPLQIEVEIVQEAGPAPD